MFMLMLACGEVKRRERGCSLYSSGGGGFKSPCYLTASPPIPHRFTAVAPFVFAFALELCQTAYHPPFGIPYNGISMVFTALFAPQVYGST